MSAGQNEASDEAVEAAAHWVLFDENEAAYGCNCGLRLDYESDDYGAVDVIVDHIAAAVRADERRRVLNPADPKIVEAVAQAVGREYGVGFATEDEMDVWRSDARKILTNIADELAQS